MKTKTSKRLAVALEYDGKNTPTITAKGIGDLADKIIDLANQNGIPLHEDKGLIDILAQINTGEEIPENLYRAVAEVIAFAYILTGKFPAGFNSSE